MATEPAVGPFELHTSDLKQIFPPQDITLIRSQFLRAAALANHFLPIDDVRVDFYGQYKTPPVWGVVAYAPGPHRMSVLFHPDHFYLRTNKSNGRARYSAVISHELHHNKRWRSQGYGQTLGEMMVSEGLALKFQREIGYPDFPEERLIRGEALQRMAERAKPLLDKIMPEYGKPLGSELSSVDRYSLGLAVVEGWSKFSGISAAAAHGVSAQDVLTPWLEQKFEIAATPCVPR